MWVVTARDGLEAGIPHRRSRVGVLRYRHHQLVEDGQLVVSDDAEVLAVRVEFFGDDIERIVEIDPLTGELLRELDSVDIYPAKHFVTSHDKLMIAIGDIQEELSERLAELKGQGRLLEASRLGFKRCVIPKSGAKVTPPKGLDVVTVSTLREAVNVGLVKNKAKSRDSETQL